MDEYLLCKEDCILREFILVIQIERKQPLVKPEKAWKAEASVKISVNETAMPCKFIAIQ